MGDRVGAEYRLEVMDFAHLLSEITMNHSLNYEKCTSEF